MGYEGKYFSKKDLLKLLDESWSYNHFKYDTDDENSEFFTDILKKCDYDVEDGHYVSYDFNKEMFFIKQRRSVKFICKICDRIIFFKFVNDTLHLQTATGVDNDSKYLACNSLIIKNIIE